MTIKKDEKTEDIILNAAIDVFLDKGKDGARMQEIADKAKINKSLLHYYFRSKDKLFVAVLRKLAQYIFPKLGRILFSDEGILEKIDKIIDSYIDLLFSNRRLPAFIIGEVNRDMKTIKEILRISGDVMKPALSTISEAMEKGEIRKMRPEHLVINIIAMCAFPIAVNQIVKEVMCEGDEERMEMLLKERKANIKEFVRASLNPNINY